MSRGPYKEPGKARPLAPIKYKKNGKLDGRWAARFVDCDGKTRQIGLFDSKTKAVDATTTAVKQAGRVRTKDGEAHSSACNSGELKRAELRLFEYADESVYPGASSMHHRTLGTALERIRRLSNYLPDPSADKPVYRLTTGDMHAALDAMRSGRLSRKSIDDAFAAASLLFRRLQERDFEVIDVAVGIKLPRRVHNYEPAEKREKRALMPDECHAFSSTLSDSERWLLWFYVSTGGRFAEGLAANATQRDRESSSIYFHQTITVYGKVDRGLKSTHHVANYFERGRSTLYPSFLDEIPRAVLRDGYW